MRQKALRENGSVKKPKFITEEDGEEEENEFEEEVDNTSTVEEEPITVEGTEDNVSKLVSQWMNDALNIGDDDEEDEDEGAGSNYRSIGEYTNDDKSDAIEEEERIAGVGLGAERKPTHVTKAQERLEEKLRRDKASTKRTNRESGGALAAPAVFDASDSRASVLGKRFKKKGGESIAKVDKILKRDKKKKKEESKAKKAIKKEEEERKKKKEEEEENKKKAVNKVEKEEIKEGDVKEDEKKVEEEEKEESKDSQNGETKAMPDFIGIKRERNFNKDKFDSPLKKKKRKTRSKQKNIKKDHRPPELRPNGKLHPKTLNNNNEDNNGNNDDNN